MEGKPDMAGAVAERPLQKPSTLGRVVRGAGRTAGAAAVGVGSMLTPAAAGVSHADLQRELDNRSAAGSTLETVGLSHQIPPEIVIPASTEGGEPPASLDFDIPNGHFYSQSIAEASSPTEGFSITNDEKAPMWDIYQKLGGSEVLGYPISSRWTDSRGFENQVTQKFFIYVRGLNPFTQQPSVRVFNIYDELARRGISFDNSVDLVPDSFDWSTIPDSVIGQGEITGSETLEDSVHSLQGYHFARVFNDPSAPVDKQFLDALKEAYLANWGLYGLPLAVKDYEEQGVVVVRGQSGALRLQKDSMEISIVNGGELAKHLGLIPEEALAPESYNDIDVLGARAPESGKPDWQLLLEEQGKSVAETGEPMIMPFIPPVEKWEEWAKEAGMSTQDFLLQAFYADAPIDGLIEQDALSTINEIRETNDLSPVYLDPSFVMAARAEAIYRFIHRQMFEENDGTIHPHEQIPGSTGFFGRWSWDRVRYFEANDGYPLDNIFLWRRPQGYTRGIPPPSFSMIRWMNSEGHKKIVLLESEVSGKPLAFGYAEAYTDDYKVAVMVIGSVWWA